MSKKLKKLPEDHACFGCKASCCNPVLGGYYVRLPLPPHHAQQSTTTPHYVFRKALDECVDFAETLIGNHIPELQAESGDLLEVRGYTVRRPEKPGAKLSNLTIEGYEVVHWRAFITVLFDCKNFDKENGVCADYDNRPPMCIEKVKPDDCYISPKYFSDADMNAALKKGLFHPSQETIKKAIYQVVSWL